MNAIHQHSLTSRWANGAATAAVVTLAISAVIVAMVAWQGGQGTMNHSWEGAVAAVAFFVAVGLSLVGFAAALSASLSHESVRGLWFGLALFPFLVLLLVVVEMSVIL